MKKKGYAKGISFSGAISREVLHYVDPNLNNQLYNTAILDVGVNYLLNNINANKFDDLISSFKSVSLNFCSNGISKVVVSGIISNNRMSEKFVVDLNKKSARMYGENLLIYISNANIPKSCFFTDGLHLVENVL